MSSFVATCCEFSNEVPGPSYTKYLKVPWHAHPVAVKITGLFFLGVLFLFKGNSLNQLNL